MNQHSTNRAQSQTAKIINIFRGYLAAGQRDGFLAELLRMMDTVKDRTSGPAEALYYWAAAVILLGELADHSYASGIRPNIIEREYLERTALVGLFEAMEGRSLDELNIAEYKPAEGGEWQAEPITFYDEETRMHYTSPDVCHYRFASAVQIEFRKVLAPVYDRA